MLKIRAAIVWLLARLGWIRPAPEANPALQAPVKLLKAERPAEPPKPASKLLKSDSKSGDPKSGGPARAPLNLPPPPPAGSPQEALLAAELEEIKDKSKRKAVKRLRQTYRSEQPPVFRDPAAPLRERLQAEEEALLTSPPAEGETRTLRWSMSMNMDMARLAEHVLLDGGYAFDWDRAATRPAVEITLWPQTQRRLIMRRLLQEFPEGRVNAGTEGLVVLKPGDGSMIMHFNRRSGALIDIIAYAGEPSDAATLGRSFILLDAGDVTRDGLDEVMNRLVRHLREHFFPPEPARDPDPASPT